MHTCVSQATECYAAAQNGGENLSVNTLESSNVVSKNTSNLLLQCPGSNDSRLATRLINCPVILLVVATAATT